MHIQSAFVLPTLTSLVMLLSSATAFANDNDEWMVFIVDGDSVFPDSNPCSANAFPGTTELFSPTGAVVGRVTVCVEFEPIFVACDEGQHTGNREPAGLGQEGFTGRYHDFGELVFELDGYREAIRVPYSGVDAAANEGENYFLRKSNAENDFTEAILAEEATGTPISLHFSIVFEGWAQTHWRGVIALRGIEPAQPGPH